MKNSFKLLAIAASISLVGCASTPYNAGQYASENQRLTSETSLNSVEPNEHFSDAMEIMYDYSQVDIDKANNLDTPFVRGGTGVKDTLSLGGTTALLASGASLLDASSFLFATSYKKDVSAVYQRNRILRFVEIQDSTTPNELDAIITSHQKELATLIANTYKTEGIEYILVDDSMFSPDVKKVWYKSAYHIIPKNSSDANKNYSKLCNKNIEEVESLIKSINGIYDANCQSQVLNHIQYVKNDKKEQVAAFEGRVVPQYVILNAILPDDFPMSALNSSYAYDFSYRPAFAWFNSPSTFAQTYGEQSLRNQFEIGNVSFLPTLTSLRTELEIPFAYQNK